MRLATHVEPARGCDLVQPLDWEAKTSARFSTIDLTFYLFSCTASDFWSIGPRQTAATGTDRPDVEPKTPDAETTIDKGQSARGGDSIQRG
ncbi:hypothetical protein EVAR_54378_1 [Eumeta japonica]|uniref:Uncharacterized protein n=1 Tax=Eumeta variegata TaxID=151549 RepID=A0A4C1Y7M4_EUMVA|nr:hypothetical protein EVAR_54378_1 [Eumeta japonica]